MACVTSALTALIGTSVHLAFPMPTSSMLATDSYQFTNPSMILHHCPDLSPTRPAITASTVTALFATKTMVFNPTSRETDTSVLFVTILTSVLRARPALQTHTTALTLSSNSRHRSATSVSQLWEITRMVNVCRLWVTVSLVAALHPSPLRPHHLSQQMLPLKCRPLLISSQPSH